MSKIGKRTMRGTCRCVRQGVRFESRRYKDSKGEYILCPVCKSKHRRK